MSVIKILNQTPHALNFKPKISFGFQCKEQIYYVILWDEGNSRRQNKDGEKEDEKKYSQQDQVGHEDPRSLSGHEPPAEHKLNKGFREIEHIC